MPRPSLGAATATVQFSRSLGSALGVGVMGVALSLLLARNLSNAGLNPNAVSVEQLLDPLGDDSAALQGTLREVLALSLQGVFVIGFIAAVLGLVVTWLAPAGRIDQLATPHSTPESRHADATEPDGRPTDVPQRGADGVLKEYDQ